MCKLVGRETGNIYAGITADFGLEEKRVIWDFKVDVPFSTFLPHIIFKGKIDLKKDIAVILGDNSSLESVDVKIQLIFNHTRTFTIESNSHLNKIKSSDWICS